MNEISYLFILPFNKNCKILALNVFFVEFKIALKGVDCVVNIFFVCFTVGDIKVEWVERGYKVKSDCLFVWVFEIELDLVFIVVESIRKCLSIF